MTVGTLLNEGKTKRIFADPDDQDAVLVVSKDDITAGDGAVKSRFDHKAEIATRTTCNVFELLQKYVPVAYLGQVNPTTFRSPIVQMLPFEVVMRRIATGSYLKRRSDVAEGTVFDPIVLEFFDKDDANHDPLLVHDFVGRRVLRYIASQPLTEGYLDERPIDLTVEELVQMRRIAEQVFLILEAAWQAQDVQLVDIKIEFGIDRDGNLLVADVVDNDSWRIWPGGNKDDMLDKQVFRNLRGVDDPKAVAKEMGRIKQNYEEVANRTNKFPTFKYTAS